MVAWIFPVGSNEDQDQVTTSFKSIVSQIKISDIIVVICFDSHKHLFTNQKNTLIIDHPKIKTPGAARNEALKFLKRINPEVVIFSDSDDFHRRNRRVETLKALETCDIVSFGYNVIYDGQYKGVRIPKKESNFFLRSNLWLPTIGMRYDVIGETLFNEHLSLGEDTVFISTIIRQANVKYNSRPIAIIDYNISEEKVIKKIGGLNGLKNELKFRFALLKTTYKKSEIFYTILGGLLSILLKPLTKLFRRVYLHLHLSKIPYK